MNEQSDPLRRNATYDHEHLMSIIDAAEPASNDSSTFTCSIIKTLPASPPEERKREPALAAIKAWERSRERLRQVERLLDAAMKIRGEASPFPLKIIADVAELRAETGRLLAIAIAAENDAFGVPQILATASTTLPKAD